MVVSCEPLQVHTADRNLLSDGRGWVKTVLSSSTKPSYLGMWEAGRRRAAKLLWKCINHGAVNKNEWPLNTRDPLHFLNVWWHSHLLQLCKKPGQKIPRRWKSTALQREHSDDRFTPGLSPRQTQTRRACTCLILKAPQTVYSQQYSPSANLLRFLSAQVNARSRATQRGCSRVTSWGFKASLNQITFVATGPLTCIYTEKIVLLT